MLLPASAAAEGLKCLEIDKPKLEMDIRHQRELLTLQLQGADDLNALLKDRIVTLERIVDKQRDAFEKETSSFIKSPTFLISLGVVLGVGTTIAIASAVN